MARAPFQVLVFPFRLIKGSIVEYAIFSRSDTGNWQGIAGGGEDEENPLQAARRESWEEAKIPTDSKFIQLQTVNSVPAYNFRDSYLWGEKLYVVPEFCFGVEVSGFRLEISWEHQATKWVRFNEGESLLRYESNRIALWELNQRVLGLGPRD
ncbi:NUDIX hydrolase [Candidatus Leptofilum sp.]|uniref:NUDIX hydrolase n=1 Tax=Candidatus Leptofilum sp. TaxID=3241576 RepID=UPI003B5C6E6E